MNASDRSRLAAYLRAAECAGAVDEEMIASAEADLGFAFPIQYGEFLLEFGAARGRGYEIYGLVEEEADSSPLWSNVRSILRRRRKVLKEETVPLQIPISDDGSDTVFFLDMERKTADGEIPIVALGPGRDEVVADNFIDFVALLTSEKGLE